MAWISSTVWNRSGPEGIVLFRESCVRRLSLCFSFVLLCPSMSFSFPCASFQVRVAGNAHVKALANLKTLAQAALTACHQHKAHVLALEKAKVEEAAAQQREAARMEKEKQKEAAKNKAKLAKAEERKLKQQAKNKAQSKAEAEAEKATVEVTEQAKKKRSRRGHGTGELNDEDHPVLQHKFTGYEIKVIVSSEGEKFTEAMALGIPCIWRCKRSSLKKVLDFSNNFSGKDMNSLLSTMHADRSAMAGEIAALAEEQADRVKKTRAGPEALQDPDVQRSLNFNIMMEDYLQRNEPVDPCQVIDSGAVERELEMIAEDDQLPAKQAQQILQKYSEVSVGGLVRGKSFTGLNPGGHALVRYQLEGSAVMAMASVKEVIDVLGDAGDPQTGADGFKHFLKASKRLEQLCPDSEELQRLFTFTSAWVNPNDASRSSIFFWQHFPVFKTKKKSTLSRCL